MFGGGEFAQCSFEYNQAADQELFSARVFNSSQPTAKKKVREEIGFY